MPLCGIEALQPLYFFKPDKKPGLPSLLQPHQHREFQVRANKAHRPEP
jgi:hypothetical protein